MLRRDFTKILGGLAASGLLLPGLNITGSRALAQGSAPKRFVVIMGALGMQMPRWVTGTPDDYQLGDALQALAPYRQTPPQSPFQAARLSARCRLAWACETTAVARH